MAIISLPSVACEALCGADGASNQTGSSTPITTISATGPTGFDISRASGFYNFTFVAGSPSMWNNLQPGGYVEYTLYTLSGGTYGVQAYYAATAANAAAGLFVNGVTQTVLQLDSTGSWTNLQLSGAAQVVLPPGSSTLRVAAVSNRQGYSLAGLLVTPASRPSSAPVTEVSASATTYFNIGAVSASSGYTFYAGNPSLWANLQPGGYIDLPLHANTGGTYALQLSYTTTLSSAPAILVNGTQQQTANLPSTGSWGNFVMSSPVTLNLPGGASTLRIAAPANFAPYNLSGATLAPAQQVAAAPGNYPLANLRFYVNPYSEAEQNVNQSCLPFFPSSPQLIAKIAVQPQGVWFGDWNSNVRSDTADVMTRAQQQGTAPILIAYDIPIRDCSGYSGGGATSAGAYQTWIQNFASGIGSGRAVVVLEPDALLQLTQPGCLNTGEQAERLSLLNFAVHTLRQTAPNASVYLDAGRAGQWAVAPADMSQRLASADLQDASGFALNVSNYIATNVTTAYGEQISQLSGNKHFIIDTSRNGQGSAGDLNWCNPLNRGLGSPTQGFSSGLVDAYVWAQNPGTSDGSCNGGPPAGHFSVAIACTLAHNAIF
ncbi:MAG TPA: glycoside hydrolase family 6 protein [Acidisarcina sp.]